MKEAKKTGWSAVIAAMSGKGVAKELERETGLDVVTLEYGWSESRMSHLRRRGMSISKKELKELAKSVKVDG